MSKREFLTGAAVVAAPLVVGGGMILYQQLTLPTPDKFGSYLYARKRRMHLERLSTLPLTQREALIGAEVARVKEFIVGPEGRRILESGSDDELWSLITMLPPILRDDIRGTAFDVTPEEWPSVLMTPSNNPMPNTLDARDLRNNRPREYANGFFIGRDQFVTNMHAATAFVRNVPDEEADRIDRMYLINNLDIIHIEMPEQRSTSIPTKILPISETTDSVHAGLVTIAGIDPDRTADADGTKLYPSMAIRITPRLAGLFTSAAEGDSYGNFVRSRYTNSFMVLLPPGETESADGRLSPPVRGMSGAPVMKSGSLAGIFHSSINGRVRRQGILYNIGFFHGPAEITRARELGMMYKVPYQ